jgi:hypothetical protein
MQRVTINTTHGPRRTDPRAHAYAVPIVREQPIPPADPPGLRTW